MARTFKADGLTYIGFDKGLEPGLTKWVAVVRVEDTYEVFALDYSDSLKELRKYLMEHYPEEHCEIVDVYCRFKASKELKISNEAGNLIRRSKIDPGQFASAVRDFVEEKVQDDQTHVFEMQGKSFTIWVASNTVVVSC